MDSIDPEKGPTLATTQPGSTDDDEGTVVGKWGFRSHVDNLDRVEASKGWFSPLLKAPSYLRVEERGIERAVEEDRVKQSIFDGYTVWAFANFTYINPPALVATRQVHIYTDHLCTDHQHLQLARWAPSWARFLGFICSYRADQLLCRLRGRALWLLRSLHRVPYHVSRTLRIWPVLPTITCACQ